MSDEVTPESSQEIEPSSQDDYEPTPYADSSWEIVGEIDDVDDFQPLEIAVLPQDRRFVDPMFGDYGGVATEAVERRWHLPEDVAYTQPLSPQEQEEELVPRLSMTQEELDAHVQQAYDQGRQEGLEEAIQANAERLSLAEERVSQILTDLQAQIVEQITLVEKQAVQLSLEIAHKVIRRAVEINPEYILEIVHDAIGLAGTAMINAVRVSPEDLEFIQLVGFDRSRSEEQNPWEFVPDPTIRSGCVVETSAGQVDYQLEPAFERIRDRVMKIAKS